MSKPKAKIKVRKPLSHQVQVDPNYAAKTWKLLRTSIEHIHRKNASGLSFEELYRNAYTMVLHKHGDYLYNGVKTTVREHLEGVCKRIVDTPDAEFVSALLAAWKEHKTSQLMIRDILMYMNSSYVRANNVLGVYDMGLVLFRDTVARAPEIKRRLLDLLLLDVTRERRGEVVDRLKLKNATAMLVELGCGTRDVYRSDFELAYVRATAKYLQSEAASRLASDGGGPYLLYAESRLVEEAARVKQCLDSSSEPTIRAVCEKELIATHMRTLIELPDSGLVAMLKLKKTEDLRRMYSLFGRVQDGHSLMRQVLSTHLKSTGALIIADAEQQGAQQTFVDGLLALRDDYDQLLSSAFRNDKLFQQTVNQAFEHFINSSPKSPEYISLYIDEKLRKGLKGATDAEVETALERTMALFRHVHEKDVFEKYYKQHLARRLLLSRSVSDDAERQMLSKLKRECGFQFTSKLEGMFTDIRVSAETNERYSQYVKTLRQSQEDEPAAARNLIKARDDEEGNPLAVDVSVRVLTTGFWPLQTVGMCALPNDVLAASKLFKKFYLDNHSGRRLTYQTNMGTAEIKAMFGVKRHELSVSTYQMALLVQFNTASTLTARELITLTQIPERDVYRNLMVVSSARYPILVRTVGVKGKPNGKDTYKLNSKFRSKLYKIRIGGVAAQKEAPAELKQTRAKVEEDRKHQIEAALVRIMKSRKTLSHNELVSECIKLLQSRFLANPMVIKTRIESLIEREYLERSSKDRRVYNYLA